MFVTFLVSTSFSFISHGFINIREYSKLDPLHIIPLGHSTLPRI